MSALGKRAAACKHWRWLPGMLAIHADKTAHRVHDDVRTFEETIGVHIAPDLDDPATLGCLLHLVREAWPDEWHEFMVPIFDGFSHWRVGCLQLARLPGTPRLIVPVSQETMKPLDWAHTEAEALVVALEAAP